MSEGFDLEAKIKACSKSESYYVEVFSYPCPCTEYYTFLEKAQHLFWFRINDGWHAVGLEAVGCDTVQGDDKG